jgi:hypothetical protein
VTKRYNLLAVASTVVLLSGTSAAQAPPCDAIGKVSFVCGIISPEDFALLPGSDWLLVSGNRAGQGAIRALDVRTTNVATLFPSSTVQTRVDSRRFPGCPGPIDSAEPVEKSKFAAHGLYLQPGSKSVHTLYVVHHGSRESIEAFEVDGAAKPPTLTWIGCIVAPDGAVFNAVVALPEGGVAATNTRGPDGVGAVLEWHAATGWQKVPGSDILRLNGLEISKDGKTFYIAAWGDQAMVRLQRGQTPVKRDVLQMPFRTDNLRLMPDGALFAAGHGGKALCSCPEETWHIGRIDPNAMRVQELLKLPYAPGFIAATVAVQIGKDIWIGTNRGDRIGRFPAP